MNQPDNGELYKLSKDFTDLSRDKRREVLKTAQSLLRIQRANRAMIAEGSTASRPGNSALPVKR